MPLAPALLHIDGRALEEAQPVHTTLGVPAPQPFRRPKFCGCSELELADNTIFLHAMIFEQLGEAATRRTFPPIPPTR